MTRLASPVSPGSLYCATRMADEGGSLVQPSGALKIRSPGTFEVGGGMAGAAWLLFAVVTVGAGALQAASKAASASRKSALSIERIINEYLAMKFGLRDMGRRKYNAAAAHDT